MNLHTVVRDCLYLNWAFPARVLPPPPPTLRYQVHSWRGSEFVFGSALLFHHDSIRLDILPLVRIGHPQLTLRLYVTDQDGVPAVLFRRMLMPAWLAPGVRLLTQQPASSAHLNFPRPSREPGAASWRWRAERGTALAVRAWLDSPAVGEGPRFGSWDETVHYFGERARGYGVSGGKLRRIDVAHDPATVWPVRAELDHQELLLQLLALNGDGAGAVLPALHSAWITPELAFSVSLALARNTPLVQAVPHPAAGRVATPVLRRAALRPRFEQAARDRASRREIADTGAAESHPALRSRAC